ncbi:MAG: SOS response-associated peptidase [Gemmataceae bacterium]
MCGRFTLTARPERVARTFALSGRLPDLAPRYNIAPTQDVPVVARRGDGTRGLALLKWGFVPSWANGPTDGVRPINARADSLDKPLFRAAFRTQRCLIAADGFYEWATAGKRKVAHHFRLADGEPFGIAGLWSHWTDGAAKLTTCCLITTTPNELVSTVHDRMPAVLPADVWDRWLDPATPVAGLSGLLRPYPADGMVSAAVGPAVNRAGYDGPDCLTPADANRPAAGCLF